MTDSLTRSADSGIDVEVITIGTDAPGPTLADDLVAGFERTPKSLPPKYFYDEHGSALFDRICDTPEYYPTRTEDAVLHECAPEVLARHPAEHIIELGSGTSRKTRRLLDACERTGLAPRYWPLDVCPEVVREAGATLRSEYPWLGVTGLAGDYLGGLDTLPAPPGRRLYVFLGGTLGNFTADESVAFLADLARCMQPGDALLLGVDRVKDPQVLEAAYDDAAGVTAAFNLNLLNVLNRELGADFPLDAFRHRARYDREQQRIEMYLDAQRAFSVQVPALERSWEFAAGESILTEISRKFTPADIEEELSRAGLSLDTAFEPDNGYFSLLLARPAAGTRD